jgi:long-chain acyl-CoA synthetase
MVASKTRASSHEDTFPKILLRNARVYGSQPAMREKDLGIWQSWTWAEVLDEVRVLSIGMQKLGLKRGMHVAIIGDNRPRLYWTFVAVQALGAIPVPVYQDSVAEEMAYVLEHAGINFAVVENQEQVDKVLEVSEKIKGIKQIIYDDDRGLLKYTVKKLHALDDVQELGRQALRDDTGELEKWLKEIAKGKGDDTSIILYTSGTTGKPKGVVLSHSNVLITAFNGNEFDNLDENEEVIAYLPMAWVGDHIFSFGQSFAAGFCVSCPESADTGQDDRREIGPTYFFAPPRVYENLLTLIMVRMEDAGKIKRAMFHYFLGVANRVGEKILNGETVSLSDRVLYWFGNFLVYAPLRNRMGFSRLKVAYTAGEAIGPEIFRFYRSLGLNLKQLYGQTEAGVYISMQPDGEIFADTVGKPAPEVEIKIAKDGEVLYRGPGVFQEYYKNAEATKKTKTKDGWVHSGDAGFFDDLGNLKIIDRASDVGSLKDGTMFPPKYIENKLKFYPDIKEVVAFGDGRKYCSAFINIDLTSVGNWAERNDVIYGSYQELAANEQVYAIIEAHVDEVNRSLANEPDVAGSQIKRFLILHKELDADDGEITRTSKVRRGFVAKRYEPLIKALYDPKKKHQKIETKVTFEDGRSGVIAGDIEIRDVKTYPPQKFAEAAE